MYEVRPATRQDIRYVAERLRKADRLELAAATGLTPLALPFILPLGSTLAWLVDGRPVCLFGCDPLSTSMQYAPWMLGTDVIKKHPIAFLRQSLRILKGWKDRPMTNVVDGRNKLHVRWLVWLGFTFHELIPEYGAQRLPFWRFEMKP